MIGPFHIDVSDEPDFQSTQHCTNPDCYTMSHTAQYCGSSQPRYCGCAFDYGEGYAARRNEEVRQAIIARLADELYP